MNYSEIDRTDLTVKKNCVGGTYYNVFFEETIVGRVEKLVMHDYTRYTTQTGICATGPVVREVWTAETVAVDTRYGMTITTCEMPTRKGAIDALHSVLVRMVPAN